MHVHMNFKCSALLARNIYIYIYVSGRAINLIPFLCSENIRILYQEEMQFMVKLQNKMFNFLDVLTSQTICQYLGY